MSDPGSNPRQPAMEKPGSTAKALYKRLISEGLPEEERQRLEELVFEDDQLFEELLAEEDELVDALAEGETAPDVAELTSRRPAVNSKRWEGTFPSILPESLKVKRT